MVRCSLSLIWFYSEENIEGLILMFTAKVALYKIHFSDPFTNHLYSQTYFLNRCHKMYGIHLKFYFLFLSFMWV